MISKYHGRFIYKGWSNKSNFEIYIASAIYIYICIYKICRYYSIWETTTCFFFDFHTVCVNVIVRGLSELTNFRKYITRIECGS